MSKKISVIMIIIIAIAVFGGCSKIMVTPATIELSLEDGRKYTEDELIDNISQAAANAIFKGFASNPKAINTIIKGTNFSLNKRATIYKLSHRLCTDNNFDWYHDAIQELPEQYMKKTEKKEFEKRTREYATAMTSIYLTDKLILFVQAK